MRKSAMAWGAATLVAGLGMAGGACARNILPATQLKEAPDGVGHMLVVPYYTAQSGNATLLNIINTDQVNGKAVKVRFRGAGNADDVYNFTLFLSPGDVWAAEVSQNPATGLARLSTPDNSCTLPTQVNADFHTTRLNPQADLPNETREGYVDIIAMADLPPGNRVYSAILHIKGAPPRPCSQGAAAPAELQALNTVAGIQAAGLGAPTTGLFANWSIFNVAEATSWSGRANAIVAMDGASRPGAAQVVMFPQNGDIPAVAASDITADPLLRSGAVSIRHFDLPDLSTPSIAQNTPAQQAAMLSGVLAKASVRNEFFTDDVVQAQTDWVFTFPTRRYSVALNHGTGLREYTVLTPAYFAESNTRLQGSAAARKVCLEDVMPRMWDRSENEADFELVYYDPWWNSFWRMNRPRPCGSAFVMSVNAGDAFAPSALVSSVSRGNLETSLRDGWGEMMFTDINQAGIPILGAAFAKATSTNIGAGISGNFGLVWEHRYTRPGDIAR